MKSFLTLIFILISLSSLFAQDKSTLPKDITISIGAGKNRFYEKKEFILAAPLETPILLNIGIFTNTEIGFEFSPIFFNDKSAYNISTEFDSTKNHFGGNILSYNAHLQHSLVNNFRMSSYIQAGMGYSALHKKQLIIGDLNELIGEGYSYTLGGGLRYQLGNEYNDVFPWFFDLSIAYTRFNFKISKYSINSKPQPLSSASWDPLNFGSIDVVLRFGYRFRKK
jgi:opacity protein-like surface antigen|tara:strand:- start:1327 stop:1998 length:672 start_codon:yes stop_codon:yes gene_type:complete